LNDFELAVSAGDVNAGNLQNGVNSGGVSNANANMSLAALNIVANSVTNTGNTMSVVAGAEGMVAGNGNITVDGVIVGGAESDTVLSAQGTLTANGGATNQGVMTLNGNNVVLADVTNTGHAADLTVSSLTAPSGKVVISGALSNTDGQTTVWAKDVSIGGAVTNNSGVTTIRGSDTNGGAVQIGAINALGGVVNLNALAGAASVTNGITVAGGALNLGDSLKNLSVDGSVQIDGNLTATANPTDVAGAMNIAAKGNPFVLSTDAVTVGGDIDITATDAVRSVVFDTVSTEVAGNVDVANAAQLTIGQDAGLGVVDIAGDLSVNNGGVFKSYASAVTAANISTDSLIELHGANLSASDGDISVDGNLYFDPSNDPVAISTGLVVRDTSTFNMNANDITVGAVSVGSVNTLNLHASDSVAINGAIVNNGIVDVDATGNVSVAGAITNKDKIDMSGAGVSFADVSNVSEFIVSATEDITIGNVSTSGNKFDLTAGTSISAGSIAQSDGVMNLSAFMLSADAISVNGTSSQANLDASTIDVVGNVSVAGDFVQGGTAGMLNHSASSFAANNLIVGGDLDINASNTLYNIGTAMRVNGYMDVLSGTSASFNVGSTITVTGLTNSGNLTLSAENGLNLGNLTNNADTLTLDSRSGAITLETLTMNGGNVIFGGTQLNLST
ncbi:MAG: hypothetical protein II208_03665, partial [Alphaproteobacteria bacterium]|nr:hypothetical protein [Alphaproteobacteria bacterium]